MAPAGLPAFDQFSPAVLKNDYPFLFTVHIAPKRNRCLVVEFHRLLHYKRIVLRSEDVLSPHI